MGKKCIHAIVHGRVQGVFFRDYTRREAQRLCVGGWVRNLPDNTVEVLFEGAAGEVDRLLAWLHTGSPMAEVTGVDSREQPAENSFTEFVI
ncbi:MAG: acylphosphatase [Desulfobulbaceae bacterium]|nr:acylphosphatase [Desulfobulbaceae bacterium]